MDDTAPSAPEGAAPAASGPNDAPADPAAPRYKFPTWFDLLALVGLFVVIQLVVAFVLLLAGARMPDAAALGSADETVAARAHAAAAQFNFYAYPLTMGLMIGLTLIYRRLRGGNRRLGRYAAPQQQVLHGDEFIALGHQIVDCGERAVHTGFVNIMDQNDRAVENAGLNIAADCLRVAVFPVLRVN